VYYNEDDPTTYLYEVYGYLLILVVLILERKSQIWINNKFGYIGCYYDKHKRKIVLVHSSEYIKNKYCSQSVLETSRNMEEDSLDYQESTWNREESKEYSRKQRLNTIQSKSEDVEKLIKTSKFDFLHYLI
jgi:uncharacterized protein YeeX (DUF496 family)